MSTFGEGKTTFAYIKALRTRTGVCENGTPWIELYEDEAIAKKIKARSEAAKRGWETRRARENNSII